MSLLRNNNAYQSYLNDFLKEVKTCCPQCNKMALVQAPGYPNKPFEAKLTCLHCGLNKSNIYGNGPLVTGRDSLLFYLVYFQICTYFGVLIPFNFNISFERFDQRLKP